jgi:hypothetical protein
MYDCSSYVRALLVAGLFAATPFTPAWAAAAPFIPNSSPSRNAQVARQYAQLPLSFEANQGQAGARAKFLARGNGYGIDLAGDAAVLSLCRTAQSSAVRNAGLATDRFRRSVTCKAVRMQLEGASLTATPIGEEKLSGTVNYFIGNDPARWRTRIPTYAKVRYPSIYPGIDLVYYGNHLELEYDFVVAPGADANKIRLRFSGLKHVRRAANGDLVLSVERGDARFRSPEIYQLVQGQRVPVGGEFALAADGEVRFRLGRYDHSRPLVIDPVLIYSSFLGGGNEAGADTANAIAVDPSGAAYIAGVATPDFPVTPGVFQPQDSGGPPDYANGFITKLNAGGTALVYSTYLGGSGVGGIGAIAIDAAGDAYVTGTTLSTDFPVTPGAFQTTNKAAANQGVTSFVTELDPTGAALVYSSYLGGSGIFNNTNGGHGDVGDGIAVDSTGGAYVIGYTYSTDFPVTPGALQTTNNAAARGQTNAFITKVNATGTALVYSTYLGGSGLSSFGVGGSPIDTGAGIAVDSDGNAYIVGSAASTDFPVTQGAFQTTNNAAALPAANAIVAKLNPAGTALVYSTYLGGSGGSTGTGLAADAFGNAYVAGYAASDFPVSSTAFQTTNKSANGYNAFITKLNSAGSALIYSTYLGGSGDACINQSSTLGGCGPTADWATGIAIDSSGDAYVTGYTDSSSFPVTQGAFQTVNNDQVQPYYENSVGGYNAFVTELNASGTALVYSTYLGGNGFGPGGSGEAIVSECGGSGVYGDQAFALALDSASNVYVTGGACSSDFPITSNAFQTTIPAWTSAFVAKLDLPVGPPLMGTSTLLTASATSATTGTNITLTATVTPASGTAVPTGIVTFLDGTTTLGTGTLNTLGQATYATTQLPVGADSITAVYGGDTNFNGNISAAVTVTISAPPPPEFSLSINPGSGTETSSTPATASITVTPVNGFDAVVTFACSGLPPGISCSFNPAKVTPAGAPVSTTVAFSGTTSAMAGPDFSGGRAPLTFAALGFGLWFLSRTRKCRRLFGRLSMIAIAMALAIGATACGSSVSSGQTTQTSTVTITAASGSISQTTTFTLTSSN